MVYRGSARDDTTRHRGVSNMFRNILFHSLTAVEKREWIIQQCISDPTVADILCTRVAQYVDTEIAKVAVEAGGSVGFTAARRLPRAVLLDEATNTLQVYSTFKDADHPLTFGVLYFAHGRGRPRDPKSAMDHASRLSWALTRYERLMASNKPLVASDVMIGAFTRDMLAEMYPRVVFDPDDVATLFMDRVVWSDFMDVADVDTAVAALRRMFTVVPASQMSAAATQRMNLFIRYFYWRPEILSVLFEHAWRIFEPASVAHLVAAGAFPHLTRQARIAMATIDNRLISALDNEADRDAAKRGHVCYLLENM